MGLHKAGGSQPPQHRNPSTGPQPKPSTPLDKLQTDCVCMCTGGWRAQTEPNVRRGTGFHEPGAADPEKMHSECVWKWPT